MPQVQYKDILTDAVDLPDDTIVLFHLPGGTIAIRHRGEFLEIAEPTATSRTRLSMQPWVSNQIHLRIERA